MAREPCRGPTSCFKTLTMLCYTTLLRANKMLHDGENLRKKQILENVAAKNLPYSAVSFIPARLLMKAPARISPQSDSVTRTRSELSPHQNLCLSKV